MKKIHILESKLNEIYDKQDFRAGTDDPYFEDEKTGEIFEATWNGDYGYPFGYWPIDYNGEEEFSIGDAYETHVNACGKCAEKYFNDIMYEQLDDAAYQLSDAMETFASEFKEYGYTYNEENNLWVSQDGSIEMNVDDFIESIRDNVSSPVDVYNYVSNFVEDYINGYEKIPTASEIYSTLGEELSEEYDFTVQKGIDDAMQDIGMDFYQYFELGHSEGRIWPRLEMMSFYETEQPDPMEIEEILRNLSEGLDIDYNALLQYHIVFENWRDGDGEVTACTISDYIEGNYGLEDKDEEEVDDTEQQYAKQGKTVFVPHLANQQQKREYFKDFRNTRDQAVYVPREKGAGNLAAYHAMRYPYGENKEMNMKNIIRLTESDLHKIVRESVKRILEGDAWGKYPVEDRTEAELDANMNDKTSGEFANAYTRDDPMVKNVEGSTLRDMLKASMGNNIR